MHKPRFRFKYLLISFIFILPILSHGQITLSQNQTNAIVGIDRKNWNGGSTAIHSQGYAHDFTLPASANPCQKITGIEVEINITNYVNNSPPPCIPGAVFYNIYYGCSTYSGGASCNTSNLIAEPNRPPGIGPPPLSFGCPLNSSGLQADFGGNFSVDIIPTFTPGCNPNWQSAVSLGFVAYEYTIDVTITFDDISCTGTGCLAPVTTVQPCNDGNACTTNDMQTILNCDGSVCVPCMGTPISTPPTPTFTQLGPYCQNTTPGTLPLSSTNTPPITGTWSPSLISTSTVGTQVYTFTPDPGQCGSTTTMSITITQPPTPTFTQLGPYCQNTTPGTLPLSSTNSPPITGTWLPSVISTSTVGTQVYTFTPAPGQCGTTTTMSITITTPPTTTFTQLGPYCQNATPGLLPSNSTNSPPITGTWAPSVINTATSGTQVYTFTPSVGQCGTVTTMSITIIPLVVPTFTQLGPYCLNEAPDLLLISSNDSPPITGTWSPSVINTTILGATVYTFTPDPGQCASPTTMTVIVTNSITPTFTQLGPYCLNEAPDLLLTSSNDSPPITGTWSPAVINTSIVGPTNYTFTPTPGQCATPTIMTVVVSNSVTPTFTQLGPYCVNDTPGILPLLSLNGITGTWSPSVISTSTAGTQTYTFTPNAGQCGTIATMMIDITSSITPTFTQLGPYCLNATPNVLPTSSNNSVPITGTWSPSTIITSTIGSNIYTFTPAAGQCASTVTMTVVVSNSVSPSFTQLGPYCLNASPGNLPTSSVNGITGTWSPSVITTSTAGSQTYTFTPNVGQCGTVSTMTVVVTSPVIPTFTQLGPYCQNAAPNVLPVSSTNTIPITGTWSPSVISTSNVGTQTYTFTPNAGQCGTTTTMMINITVPVTPTFTQLGPFCQNVTPTALPTSSNNTTPILGTWSPSIINTSTIGTQTYTFTPNAGQCGNIATMTISVTTPVNPTFAQLGPYCQNASPNLLPTSSNNSVPITGTWSPTTINTSTIGSSIYTFTPAAGQCASPTTMTVVVSNSVTPTFTQLGPYCLNASPGNLPTSSVNGISGTWSPSVINTATIGTGLYTFTPGAGQCGTVTTMTINILNSLSPTFTQLGPYCQGATPNVLPGSSTNTTPISGTWSPSTINTSNPGAQTYTFTPNAGQCSTVTTMTINVTAPITPTFTQLGPYCQSATPNALPGSSTNTTPISGTWSPSVINTSALGSNVYTFTPTTGQCASPTTMTIVISDGVTPTFNQLGPYCLNSSPGNLPASSVNGISGTWSPSVINTSTIGPTVYTFTPAAGQCGKVATMNIEITNSLTPTFTQLGPYCQDATPNALPISSNNAVPIAGAWQPAFINTSSVGSSVYTFTPNSGQCASTTTMTVSVSANLTPTFNQLGPYCLNETPSNLATISVNGMAGTWSPSVVNTSVIGPKTYTFTPVAGQCITSTNMIINVLSSPSAVATNITNATCGLANGAINIGLVTSGTPPHSFNFNNLGFGTTTTFTNLVAGAFPLTIEDSNGCTFDTVINIADSSSGPCGEISGWVANIFSPNEDGVNDILKIFIGQDIKQVNKFEIYDRWGSKVFTQSNITSNDNQEGWDGRYQGNYVTSGVYVYFAQIELLSGKLITQKGSVTVIY